MKSRRTTLLAALPLLAVCLLPETVRAGASCYFSPKPLTLSFGRLGVSDLQGATTTGGFTEACLQGLQTDVVGVCVKIGKGGSGAEFGRTMKDGAGNSIAYGLYHDPQATIPWLGDSETISLSAPYDKMNGANLQGTVYAKILSATASLPAGEYRDDVAGATFVAGETGYDGVSNVCLSGGTPGDALLLSVGVTLQASCMITATDMVFPAAASPTSSVRATSALTVACTKDTPYEVGLSSGAGVSATWMARKLTGPGGARIDYNLFRDAAHALPWGDDAGLRLSGVGVGRPQTLTVYGFAPPQPIGPPGLYSDTINVTLTY